ncbi:MAG TPA: CSLREA domain-containing protein [Aggregatilineales bacterium]|nr:CSLREA domain-containing protein [Aggregatilineales bacterium]
MKESRPDPFLPFVRPLLVASILVMLLAPGLDIAPAYAAALVVTTSVDDNIVNGNCTLREAIIAANTGTPVDACAAGSGINTITFATNGVVLNSSLPAIASNTSLIINGGSNNVVIFDPAQNGDVFTVNAAANLALQNLHFATINGGYCVNSAGNLTISNTYYADCIVGIKGTRGQITIANSTGSALYTLNAVVPVKVSHSTFSRGVPWTFYLGTGPLTINGSTFIGHPFNSSIRGRGPMTIDRTEFNNGSFGAGAAGIEVDGTSLTLTNSIVSGKVQTGVDLFEDAQAVITNSTIASNANGVGVKQDGSKVTLRNTIVYSTTMDCITNFGAPNVQDDGNNTQFLGGCASIPVANPQLDSNFRPMPGSPVIDAGLTSWCPSIDFYGTSRTLDGDGHCDTGAVESAPGVAPTAAYLRALLLSCVRDQGLLNSLKVKVDARQWNPIINEVKAQSGKKISLNCANSLIGVATFLLNSPAR